MEDLNKAEIDGRLALHGVKHGRQQSDGYFKLSQGPTKKDLIN